MPLGMRRLGINGGWNTERGPSARIAIPSQYSPIANAGLAVPYLTTVENAIYQLDGWPRKMPGASRVNATTTGVTDAVTGIFDYRKAGTAGSATSKHVIYSGTQIYTETAGTMASIKSGLEANKMPWAEVMNDLLILSSTSLVDVPMTYDQTSVANLGGTPPKFSVAVQHKDRLWAFGVASNPSRLYYCVRGNQADWVGAGSGSIDIAPNDGDEIRAIASHKNELIVFKGPTRRSIYRITGSDPTGADAFSLLEYIKGVGAVNQQSLVRLRDDLVFPDDQGLHSLQATAAFGDYNVAALSGDIQTWWVSGLNHSRMTSIWGMNYAAQGYALWTLTTAAGSTNNCVLLWDYRFTPERFALWPAYAAACLAPVVDTNSAIVPWYGTYTGLVLRGDRVDRNLDGAAYSYRSVFPYIDFGDAYFDKSLNTYRIAYTPHTGTFTFGVQRDQAGRKEYMLSQAGTGDTLGASATPFMLDSSRLGSGLYTQVFGDLEGQFKEVAFDFTAPVLNTDCEVHDFAIEYGSAGIGHAMPVG